MANLVLAIDQGTTATTVMLFDSSLNIVARESVEILPTYPQYGWVEHNLSEIWSRTRLAIKKILSQKDYAKEIAAIGITNQRETVGVWDKKSGTPLHHAIVWQCRRTADRCEELKKISGLEEKIKNSTGLVMHPYFSSTKMEWFIKNISGLTQKLSAAQAVFGNIDTYLLFMLSGGQAHATDVSNASRTMLMNLRSLEWDSELLSLFQIPEQALPKICPSSGIFGKTKGLDFLPDGIPISGILGDQQSALLGQLCLNSGEAKCTYGTGSFLVCNTGTEIKFSKHGLLTTLAWKINGKTQYALEGSSFVAGAAVQFMRDNLGVIQSSAEIEPLAKKASDDQMGDLVFVPSLTGLGAPHWNAKATGMLYGLTRGTQKEHIARATLEGIALQNDDLFTALAEDLRPEKLISIRVDGGASANSFLMQLQADLAGIPITRPHILDTTAVGAAIAAGVGVGIWNDPVDTKKFWREEKTFLPNTNNSSLSFLRSKWKRAIRQILTE